jgi:ABC-type sugar transport system ATPase subunit
VNSLHLIEYVYPGSKTRVFDDAGNGVIFISSELDEMASYCDRIIILRKGEIVDIGNLAEEMRRSRISIRSAWASWGIPEGP